MDPQNITPEERQRYPNLLIILGVIALALLAYYLYSRHQATQRKNKNIKPPNQSKKDPQHQATFH